MKLALILNVIDPKIGGVMIMGDRGTGKSTTIRALADLLPEMKVVDKDPFNSGRARGGGLFGVWGGGVDTRGGGCPIKGEGGGVGTGGGVPIKGEGRGGAGVLEVQIGGSNERGVGEGKGMRENTGEGGKQCTGGGGVV